MRKRILFILLIMALIYIAEPFIKEGISWTIPQEVSTEPITLSNSQAIGHAPEPSTFILFLGGITGFLVNFIRKSYDKFKRFSDVFLACIGLVLTAPILA
jgi:hypothetical protein